MKWYTMNSEQTYKLEIQSIKKYTLNTVKKLKEEKEQNIKQYSSNPEIVNKGEKRNKNQKGGKMQDNRHNQTISMIILEANRQNTPIKGDYQAELSKEDVSV